MNLIPWTCVLAPGRNTARPVFTDGKSLSGAYSHVRGLYILVFFPPASSQF